MPALTGEQFIALVTLLLGSAGTAAGVVWRFIVKPRDKRLSDLEQAQEEARLARERLLEFVMARVSQAEKERDASTARAEVAINSNVILSDLVKEQTSVIRDGNKATLEEIRSIKAIVEVTQRAVLRA